MLDLPFVFVCVLFTDTRKKHLTSDKIMKMHMRLERKMISLRINLDVIREWMTFVRHVDRPLLQLIDQLANTILPHQVDNINHINPQPVHVHYYITRDRSCSTAMVETLDKL